MISVKAIYDGKNIKLLEEVKLNFPRKVIITFLDDEESDFSGKEIMGVAEKGGSFDFLNDPQEDVYTDENLKVKYK